jgi:DNA repair exonuclease SbcCD ATPase subunit
MNYKTFTQVVIIGAANFTVFMKLSSNARREIVDDFLDTKILSDMNKLLKIKMADTKNILTSVNSDIAIKTNSIQLKEGYVAKLEAARTGKLALLEQEVKNLTLQEKQIITEISFFEEEIERLSTDAERGDSLQETVTKLNMFEKRFKSNIKSFNEKIKYYQEITHCPQCEQDICDEHKALMINNSQENISTQEAELKDISSKIESVKKKLENVKIKQNELTMNAKLLTAKNAELRMVGINKTNLTKEIAALEKSSENLDEEKESLKLVASQAIALIDQKKALMHKKNIHDTATQLLKDQGIKTSIVRKYLPTLNSLINKYCAELDFFVLFEFDENFDETIKSRHRDKFSYGSFSEGQKKRIDFAIVFAWRELIRQKNSIDTNLLILDEVFDGSLDAEGVELFKNIIFGTIMKDYNVVLISHWPDWNSTFPNNITVELKNNFSVITEC